MTFIAWGCLAVALSPALWAWAEQLSTTAGDRYALVGLGLWLAALASRRRRVTARPGGLALVGAALVLQLVAIVADAWALSWWALPLGVLGLGLYLGRPEPRVSLLALAAVPLPFSLLLLGSPALETTWARLAAALLGAAGVASQAVGPLLRVGAADVHLTAYHGGLPLLVCLAAIGWFAGLASPRPRSALLGAGLGGLAAAPAALLLTLAAGVLATRSADAALGLLDAGWCVVSLLALGVLAGLRWRHRERAGGVR